MDSIVLNTQICSSRNFLMQYAIKFTRNTDDADDLVQDTMIKALRYQEKYKPGTNLQGWLFTIMKNTFINNYRALKRRRVVLVSETDPWLCPVNSQTSRNSGESKFVINDVSNAIHQLKPGYAFPFLRYFEGYKYEEIAAEMEIPVGTVKTRIHLARKFLKATLKMYQDSDLH